MFYSCYSTPWARFSSKQGVLNIDDIVDVRASDHTDVLSTDLLATADLAGAKLNAFAKCYHNTEKVLVENERFSTFYTHFS